MNCGLKLDEVKGVDIVAHRGEDAVNVLQSSGAREVKLVGLLRVVSGRKDDTNHLEEGVILVELNDIIGTLATSEEELGFQHLLSLSRRL